MTDSRVSPSFTGDERAMLTGWLDYHRATLANKCEGLTSEQLRTRTVPPSTLSLLGLVRHLAEVERYWFTTVFAGRETAPLYCSTTDVDGDLDNIETADPTEAFRAWHAECAAGRETVESAESMSQLSQGTRRGEHVNLRWILIHMIEEYARHNGHADLLRETIDGTVGV